MMTQEQAREEIERRWPGQLGVTLFTEEYPDGALTRCFIVYRQAGQEELWGWGMDWESALSNATNNGHIGNLP